MSAIIYALNGQESETGDSYHWPDLGCHVEGCRDHQGRASPRDEANHPKLAHTASSSASVRSGMRPLEVARCGIATALRMLDKSSAFVTLGALMAGFSCLDIAVSSVVDRVIIAQSLEKVNGNITIFAIFLTARLTLRAPLTATVFVCVGRVGDDDAAHDTRDERD